MKKLILTYVLLNFATINAQNQSSNDNQSRFSIIPSYGYAWRTAETPSGISVEELNIIKQLKEGTNFEIIGLYQINKNNKDSHLGLKYSRYNANANGFINIEGLNIAYNTDDLISYFGPVYARTNSYKNGELFFDVSLGYIYYKSASNASYQSQVANSIIEGDNLGLSASISYLFKISPAFSIGPYLGFTTGTLSEVKIKDNNSTTTRSLEDDEKEGLGRINLSIQAKFNF
jgi:hypothetical protein